MTNIEFAKFIVYGDLQAECSLNDIYLQDIITSKGTNYCIFMLANAELVKLAQKPNSVSDGAVSMSWSERRSQLTDIMQKAKNEEYNAPEPETITNNAMNMVYT